MINKLKQGKGITLVSVVITVVIMAILIAIIVKTSTDDNIVGTTQNATAKYKNALVFQTINAAFISERSIYEDGFITETEMWNNIEKSIENNKDLKQYGNVNVTSKTAGLNVTVGEKYSYSITIDGVEEL